MIRKRLNLVRLTCACLLLTAGLGNAQPPYGNGASTAGPAASNQPLFAAPAIPADSQLDPGGQNPPDASEIGAPFGDRYGNPAPYQGLLPQPQRNFAGSQPTHSMPSYHPPAPAQGGQPFAKPAAQDAPPAPPAPRGETRPIEGGQIIARVGSEWVTADEVLPTVNEMIESKIDQIPPDQLPSIRRMLMKRQLLQLIETKLLYADARRTIPEENFPNVEKKLAEEFDKREVPDLLKKTKTESVAELNAKLAEMGTSLTHQQRMYSQRLLATQWLRQNVNLDREITHDEMLSYYQEHIGEFEFEAKARWEEVAVRFSEFPGKAEAYRALAQWGNMVWGGAPFAEVARRHSQGLTAEDGGQHDWTTRGSLVSQELNRAVFTLPVGQLSPIIESNLGFHIIRVIERRDAGRTPFVEAQVDIKEKIRKKNTSEVVNKYLANLREETRVWTIFDDDLEPESESESESGEPQLSSRGRYEGQSHGLK